MLCYTKTLHTKVLKGSSKNIMQTNVVILALHLYCTYFTVINMFCWKTDHKRARVYFLDWIHIEIKRGTITKLRDMNQVCCVGPLYAPLTTKRKSVFPALIFMLIRTHIRIKWKKVEVFECMLPLMQNSLLDWRCTREFWDKKRTIQHEDGPLIKALSGSNDILLAHCGNCWLSVLQSVVQSCSVWNMPWFGFSKWLNFPWPDEVPCIAK